MRSYLLLLRDFESLNVFTLLVMQDQNFRIQQNFLSSHDYLLVSIDHSLFLLLVKLIWIFRRITISFARS